MIANIYILEMVVKELISINLILQIAVLVNGQEKYEMIL